MLEAGQALIDVPFLALVVAALLAEARPPRTGWTVPMLLAAAGLLRPEAWLLASRGRLGRPRRRRAIALAGRPRARRARALAAQDLAATGDPLFSLHAHAGSPQQLARPRGLDSALRLAPVSWHDAHRARGVARPRGCRGRPRAADDATLLPAAVAGLGLVTFVVLGLAGCRC